MSYRGRRIVAFIPWGRARTADLLVRYLRRDHDRGILDEVLLCLNTDPDQHEDVAYAERLADEQPGLFTLVPRPGVGSPADWAIPEDWRRGHREPKQMNIDRFYWHMQDRGAVYVRCDDDLVWLHPGWLTAMVDAKLDHPERLAVFPTIWNNAVCTWFMQQHGRLPSSWPPVSKSVVDPNGWGSGEFAVDLHHHLLDLLEDDPSAPGLPFDAEHEMGRREQFSVSCFAAEGEVFADVGGVMVYDGGCPPSEEHWLTIHRTGQLGRSNWITGRAHVAHYSFFKQRPELDRTDVLARYRALAWSV